MQPITALATTSFTTVWSLIGNFIALIILAGILFFFAQRSGRGAFLAFVISLYAGYALYLVFPYTSAIIKALGATATNTAIVSVILYGIAVAIPYYLIRRSASADLFRVGPLALIVLVVLTAGFLLAFGNHALSVSSLYSYPAPLAHLFAPAEYYFWWFIAPLVGFLFLAR